MSTNKPKCDKRLFESYEGGTGLMFICSRPAGHKGPHRHQISKTEYYSWPNNDNAGN